MSDQDFMDGMLAELTRVLEAATPGPWETGVSYSYSLVNDTDKVASWPCGPVPPGRCSNCARSPAPCPVTVPVPSNYIRPDEPAHVTRTEPDHEYGAWWREITSATTRASISGMLDYEAGGVLREADAVAISAMRNALPEILAERTRLRATLERVRNEASLLNDTLASLRHQPRCVAGGPHEDCSCGLYGVRLRAALVVQAFATPEPARVETLPMRTRLRERATGFEWIVTAVPDARHPDSYRLAGGSRPGAIVDASVEVIAREFERML